MDATVATGAAAMMAIRVLLDHDVPEESINLVSLLMAESGVLSPSLVMGHGSKAHFRSAHHCLRISKCENCDHGSRSGNK